MQVRRITPVIVALALLAGLITAVTIVVTSPPGPPRQVTGTAAGRPHRMPASVTVGQIVNGRFVPGAQAASASGAPGTGRTFTGPVPKTAGKPPPGAVPPAAKPKPVSLPARGKTPPETVVPAAPVPPAKKAGYVAKTSRALPPAGPSVITYANADGTRTAFDFQSPVNYRKPDGTWATISTTLVPAAGSPAASASASAPVPPSTGAASGPATAAMISPAASATGPGTAAASPSSPGATTAGPPLPATPATSSAPAPPAAPSAPPASGWTEQSAAEPASFAPYANAADLARLPLGAGHAVAFGVSGATAAPGAAQQSTVTYAGVRQDATITLSAGAGMIKEQIVLAAPDAPATWVFPLHLTGLTATLGAGGSIYFTDASGKVIAYVPHGSMADSNVDPHSGDGAVSDGVSYSLTTYQGGPAIAMTLDASWLASPARVYPVTVDPTLVNVTVSDQAGSGSTYAESPYTSDFSAQPEVRAGTYDGGAHQARAYLAFAGLGAALQNDTVLGVRLGIFNSWSYSCEPRPVYVYQVTHSWQPGDSMSWSSAPSTGQVVGQQSFATGWVPLGSTASPCPASWQGIDLSQAGTDLVNGWTHGAVNDGLAIGASATDSHGWKKFVSHAGAQQAGGAGNPFLAVTYTQDGASYTLSRRPVVTAVTPSQDGAIKVTLKNTGATTWTDAAGYKLSYETYSNGHLVANYTPAVTSVGTVAPGGTVTVNAAVKALPYGSYAVNFDMYHGATAFSAEGIAPFAMGLNIPQPPTVNNVYPPTGYVAPTLGVQLATAATGAATYRFVVTCEPVPNQLCVQSTVDSHAITSAHWTIPRAAMQWDTTYQWTVTATSSSGATTTVGPMTLTTEVPQPGITSGLGGGGQAYDPLSGNFTTSATDAAVATAGPPLRIDRTYNSMDPRTTGAFGAGWSTLIDAAVQPDSDGTSNVTVTTPGGQEVRFGANGDGSYAPPFGSTAVLVHQADGTWSYRDASDNVYTFTAGGQLSQVTDVNRLTETFSPDPGNPAGPITTIANGVSHRTLTLTWATPAGTAIQHVSSVTTQAPAAGQPPLQWTYNYAGDQLTSVCAPAIASGGGCAPACQPAVGCTQYGYGTGSDYQASVLDSGPQSDWQLGDASGSATALDEVDVNLGTTDGTYSNVTLGRDAGLPLGGIDPSKAPKAAYFDGSSSVLTLPARLLSDSTDVSIGLWFKAASPSASGVLFGYAADALSNANGPIDDHVPALYVGTNGHLYGEIWNGTTDTISSPATVTEGNWHYAVITASGTSQSLYLDGAPVGGAVAGQIDPLDMTSDTVGAGFWSGNWPSVSGSIGHFNGDIAQVAVYPHPLGRAAITRQWSLATTATAEMTTITLPSGMVAQQASYDPAGNRLASYTDPNGATWTIGDPAASGLKAASDALGEVTDRVTVTGPAGRRLSYDYDMLNGGRLDSASVNGDTVSYVYDAAGYLTEKFDADGNQACLTNDAQGNVLSRSWYPVQGAGSSGGGTGPPPACAVATSSGNCWSTGNACTSYNTYTSYDAASPLDPQNNLMLTSADARSASSTDTTYRARYAYNSTGQLLSQTTPATSDFPSGRATTYAYTAGTEAAYCPTGAEPDCGKTIPARLLLSKTTPGGATTSYQYYADGDIAKLTEPSGRSTVYAYDQLGRAITSTVYTTTFPSGEQTSYAYNAMGQPVTTTYPGVPDRVTNVTHTRQDSYAYDADGDLLSLTQSDLTGGDAPRLTSYTYDGQDRVATRTDPAGATTGGTSQSGANDNFGTASASPDGAVTSYDYDDFGNVTKRVDPNGNEYDFTFNEYNEPTQETLHTSSASQANPTPGCTAPATPDPTGCDLVLDSRAYDPAGLLAATTDAMGRITSYGYDHDQELIAVTRQDPCTTAGDPTCPVTSPTGPSVARQLVYQYDGAGNQIGQIHYALGNGAAVANTATVSSYDAAGRLASVITDPTPAASATVNNGFGQDGYANRSVSYAYDADNHLTAQTVGSPAAGGTSVTSYTYDTAGDRLSQSVVNGSASLTTKWAYDQNGLPLTMIAPDGNVSGGTPANYTTTYAYDLAGDLVTQTAPTVSVQSYNPQTGTPQASTVQPATIYGYDTFGDQAQVKDPDLNVTTAAYDGDGRITSLTQPSYAPPGTSSAITPTTGYAYDGNGNVTQATDPDGNVVCYAHDALGDVTSASVPQLNGTCASGSSPPSWAYTYDGDGEQLSATDPLGKASQATYDYFGEQATATDALGNTTSYAYDYLGDLTKVATPENVVTTTAYDHLGEPVSVTDGAGNTSSYQYGYAGQLTYAFSPDGGFTRYGYDQARRLTGASDFPPAGQGQATVALRSQSMGYDASGNLTSQTDWNGNKTTYAYNAVGELTSQVVPVSSSASIPTSYGYDAAGNQTAITSGNGNTTWTTYNPLNLPESVTEPATTAGQAASDRTWTTSYDASGNRVAVSQPGGVSLLYGYDAMGNLTSQSGSGATAPTAAQSLSYDLDGRLASATAPGGTDTFTYYDNGNLHQASGPSGTSSFTYTKDDLVKSATTSGGTTSYAYDSAGRLSTLADPLTGATLTYSYNKDSLPASIGYSVGGASGPTQSFGYDGLQRLTSQTVKSASGSTLASQSYGYDAAGNMTSQSAGGLMTAGTTTYSYDKAGRLASSASGGTPTTYGYDSDGNLTQSGGTSYAYNAQDQVTSSATAAGTTSYAYTLNGALASVTAPGGSAQSYTTDAYGWVATAPNSMSYGYDALGRLVNRTAGSATTSLSYLGASATLASDGTRNYTSDPSGAMAATQVPGGTGYTVMSNAHGDLAATFSPTSSAAGLAGSATYSPYGTPAATGYRPYVGYQGDYTDPSTGQVMMGARWYNPGTGGFATNDVIAGSPLPATVDGNPYAYTDGNPLTETDPTGHLWGWLNPAKSVEGWLADGSQIAQDYLGIPAAASRWWTIGAALLAFAPEAGIVLGLTAAFTVASWIMAPAVNGDDTCLVTCDYSAADPADHGMHNVRRQGASTATGEIGEAAYPFGPPPPPPPPRDCFAVHRCQAGEVSNAIAKDVIDTNPVKVITSAKAACATGPCQTIGVHVHDDTAGGEKQILTSGPTTGGATVQQDPTPLPAAAGGSQGGGACPPSSGSGAGGGASSQQGVRPGYDPEFPSIELTNFRGRFNAYLDRLGMKRLPDKNTPGGGWDAHHAIPQLYRNINHPEFTDFDFDAPSNMRGVPGSSMNSRLANLHQDITNAWTVFQQLNPDATRAQIEDFANQIDRRYGAYYWGECK